MSAKLFDPEGQGQLLPKTIGILTKVFCTSGPKLVILAWTGDDLWCGQAQNWVNFDFKLNFIITHTPTPPPKTRPTLERRATLGHFRSIKPNMINHFAN